MGSFTGYSASVCLVSSLQRVCVCMFSILSALLLVKVLFVFVFVLHCYAPVWLPYRKVEHVAVNVSVVYSCRSLYVVTDEGLRLKPTHCHSCLSDNIMSTHHIRLNWAHVIHD